MKFSVEIADALNVPDFFDVNTELQVLTQKMTTDSDRTKAFFKAIDTRDVLPFYKAASNIKLKMKKHLKKDITLVRINTGGKVFGSPANFHIDYTSDYYYTVVLFTELCWDTQWGGELVVHNPDTKKYHYHTYIPNTAVFFPSNWQHCGFSPNNFTSKMRTTLAFSYIETEHVDSMSVREIKKAHKYQFNML